MMIARDTDPEAHAVQLHLLRRLGGSGRVALLASMSEQAREISRSGIRARHLEYSDNQVRDALSKILLGEALFQEIFSKERVQQP